MSYGDGDDSGRGVAAKQSARTLQQAQQQAAAAVGMLESHVDGDPSVAIVAADLPANSPMPDVHRAVMTYFFQLEPLLHARAPGHYRGDYYDEPITEVKVPAGPAIDGYGQHETEVIYSLADLEDWQLRTVQRPGQHGHEQSRLFLSPLGYSDINRKLMQAQGALGLAVDAIEERNQPLDDASMI